MASFLIALVFASIVCGTPRTPQVMINDSPLPTLPIRSPTRRTISDMPITRYAPNTLVPLLHSYSGVPSGCVLYLNFLGGSVAGTMWNTLTSVPSYQALPFDLDGNHTFMNPQEQLVIYDVWQRVTEDYSP